MLVVETLVACRVWGILEGIWLFCVVVELVLCRRLVVSHQCVEGKDDA